MLPEGFWELVSHKTENKGSYNHTNKEVQDAIIRAADLFFTLCLHKGKMNATYCTKGRGQAVLGLRIEQSGHHLHWKLGKETKPNKAEVTWQLESHNEIDNEQSKESICFFKLCYKAHFYFTGYPRPSFFPAHCFDSFCCFPLIWPMQSPIRKLAKAALRWNTRSYSLQNR